MLAADTNVIFPFATTVGDYAMNSIAAFRQTNIHAQNAELGCYIAEPLWNEGIATSEVRQICNDLFENTNIIRIFAETFSNNADSCWVLEKGGFQYAGLLRKNVVKSKEILDMKIYALVRE